MLVPHVREWRQSSNTGRVASCTLEGAELALWGARDRPLDLVSLVRADTRCVVLHPADDAPPLQRDGRRVRLLVPDGTWRQSVRIARKLAAIPDVERASLPPSAEGQDEGAWLRRAPSAEQLGTGYAIAAALEVLGDVEAAAQLRAAVRVMVDRSLFVRGKLAPDQVLGGIPLAVRRAMSTLPQPAAPGVVVDEQVNEQHAEGEIGEVDEHEQAEV